MFRDCSDLNFKEYLDIIKEPIALDVIKEKLDRENPEMVRLHNFELEKNQQCSNFRDFFFSIPIFLNSYLTYEKCSGIA